MAKNTSAGPAAGEQDGSGREARLAEENIQLRAALRRGGVVDPSTIPAADPPPKAERDWSPAERVQGQTVSQGRPRDGRRIPQTFGQGRFTWEAHMPADVTAPICRFRLDSDHPADAARAYMQHVGIIKTVNKIACRIVDESDPTEAVPPGPPAASGAAA